MWQDYVFSFGGLIFIVALFPTLFGAWHNKPPILTSFLTGSVLALFGYTFFTLNLDFSGWVSLAQAAVWFAIGYEKWLGPEVPPRWIKLPHIHWHKHSHTKGTYRYGECRCGHRQAIYNSSGGYSGWDRPWLEQAKNGWHWAGPYGTHKHGH